MTSSEDSEVSRATDGRGSGRVDGEPEEAATSPDPRNSPVRAPGQIYLPADNGQRSAQHPSYDPHGGLPSPATLQRLDALFPDSNISERMMRRVEAEQIARHEHEKRVDDLAKYEAESQRRESDGVQAISRQNGNRAERVLYVLLIVGVVLIVAGYVKIGGLLLTSAMVAIVGSFLSQRIGWRRRN